MLTTDLSGVVSSERSAVVDSWFAAPVSGAKLGDYPCLDNPTLAAEFALRLEALESDALPMELTLDQLPRRSYSARSARHSCLLTPSPQRVRTRSTPRM